jgi:hypothetical protein
LETIGEQFLAGYGHAVEARSVAEAEARLEAIPAQFRGFAYEGAGMGYAVLDAMPVPGGGRTGRFYASPGGDAHIYTAYVGVGWAMARLPRFLWSRLTAPDPLLRWLVLDGYGFHQAYFHTDKYVHRQFREERFPWPAEGPADYAARAIDQGIGRALWFVGGTDAEAVASLIERFPADRHGDLYAGAGLAATYACGVEEEELQRFRDRAGEHRFHLAQGSAFAAEARLRGGIVLPQTAVATQVLCGMTPQEAARICAETRPGLGIADAQPNFEIWRRRITDVFASKTEVVQS